MSQGNTLYIPLAGCLDSGLVGSFGGLGCVDCGVESVILSCYTSKHYVVAASGELARVCIISKAFDC